MDAPEARLIMVRQVVVTAPHTPRSQDTKAEVESPLLDFGNDSQFLAFLNEHMVNGTETISPVADQPNDQNTLAVNPQANDPSPFIKPLQPSVYDRLYTAATRVSSVRQVPRMRRPGNTSVSRRPLTVPEPFSFNSYKSGGMAAASEKDREKPVSTLAPRPRATRSLTRPVSPKLATRVRLSSRTTLPSDTASQAHPLASVYNGRQKTPAPTKIASSQNASAEFKSFHAQPVRSQLGTVPVVNKRPLTVPRPFSFASGSLSALQSKQVRPQSSGSAPRMTRSSEGSEDDKGLAFKARSVPYRAPFIPKRSTKPLTALPEDLRFQTETRAEQRHKFDQKITEKEAQRQKIGEDQQRAKEEQERRSVAQLRASMVHKARPMPEFNSDLSGSSGSIVRRNTAPGPPTVDK